MLARLLLLFIGIPLVELALFLVIGGRIGPVATVATVILTGMLGAWLTKQQGLRVLSRYQQAVTEGRLPHEEVVEGLMILVAGAVLLTPGFLTDAIGFALLVPPVRAAVRQRLTGYLAGRVNLAGEAMQDAERQSSSKSDVIEIEAEVIEEEEKF